MEISRRFVMPHDSLLRRGVAIADTVKHAGPPWRKAAAADPAVLTMPSARATFLHLSRRERSRRKAQRVRDLPQIQRSANGRYVSHHSNPARRAEVSLCKSNVAPPAKIKTAPADRHSITRRAVRAVHRHGDTGHAERALILQHERVQ